VAIWPFVQETLHLFWFNNNNNQQQCLWYCPHDHGHCESSPSSSDECRLSAEWPPTLLPSQPTWAVNPPINGCYHPHPPSPFVMITRPESWYSFYRPTCVTYYILCLKIDGMLESFIASTYYIASDIFYLLFFPRLISAAADWMSSILWHMVWP